MSGIAGYLGSPQPPSVLRVMTGKMMHRGPDGEVFYEETPVFFGVRQFFANATDEGEQIFIDADRELAIAFTGEFYNARDEREALEKRGARFTGNSVAETVLRLYEAYGVSCVSRMRGAFVFAVHDQPKALVFIARDPQGVKPLYYATSQSGTFIFASEIKALFEHPSLSAEPDLRGIDAFLSLGCSPGPDSMFKGVHKLPAGHHILWNPGLHVMIEPYWKWESFARPDPVLKTDDDFRARFATLFEETVLAQQGEGGAVFLDGSMESAAIAAVMAKNSKAPVQAFSLDLKGEAGFDPLGIAANLRCESEGVSFGTQDMDKLPEVIWALDEPVADLSVTAHYVMSRVATKKTRVALSGASAAELFVSRPEHDIVLQAAGRSRSYYGAVRSFYSLLPQGSLAKSFGYDGVIGPRTKRRFFDLVEAFRTEPLWRQFLLTIAIFAGREKQELYAGGMTHVIETFSDLQRDPEGWSSRMSTLLGIEHMARLSDGVLAPAEKISMFSSLECRLPFMDHRLSEFLIGLPDHLRHGGGSHKLLLRDYIDKAHPGLVQPVKQTPSRPPSVADCMAASPLREMIEVCLSETSVRRREIFDWKAVKPLLAGVKTGETLYARQVFALLSLELWFRIFVDNEKGWMSH